MTRWTESIDQFLHYLRFERHYSVKTMETYQRILHRSAQYFSKVAQLSQWQECHKSLIQQWIGELRKRRLSPSSLNLYLSALRSFFRWFFRDDPAQFQPLSCRVHSRRQRLPKIISPDQMLHLLAIPDTSPIAVRDRTVLELFYSSGLRLTELIQLQCGALSHDKMLLNIHGKGNRQRWVPVGQRAKHQLDMWLQLRQRHQITSPYLFTTMTGRPLSARAIQKRVVYWSLRRLGFPVHPHVLRHTFATHFLSETQDIRAVQEVLGHQKLATTQRYTHLDFKKISEIYDRAHPRQQRPSPKFTTAHPKQ